MNGTLWKMEFEKALPKLAGVLDSLQMHRAVLLVSCRIRVDFFEEASHGGTGGVWVGDAEGEYLLGIRKGLRRRSEELTAYHELAHVLAIDLFDEEVWTHGPWWCRIVEALGYPQEARKYGRRERAAAREVSRLRLVDRPCAARGHAGVPEQGVREEVVDPGVGEDDQGALRDARGS